MKNYKRFAIDLAKQAGKIIRNDFKLGMKKKWKANNTPLTKTDLIINQLVIDSVKQTFPNHSILSEEGNDFSEKSDYVWVCDPLDGTIPFSHGIPVCAFSLALVYKGESILGVVYDPFMDRMFFAEKGKGAFMNEKKISVSPRDTLKHSLLSVVHWNNAPFDFSRLAVVLKNEGVRISNISIAYMGALTAARKVLVEEAGGKVTNIFGNEQRYDRPIKGHLVTNGLLHTALLKLIQKHVR